MELNASQMQELVRLFVESDLEDLHVEVGGARLVVSKGNAKPPADGPPHVPQPTEQPHLGEVRQAPATVARVAGGGTVTSEQPAEASTPGAEVDGLFAVQSPSVGVFYRRPAPDQDPYVDVGSDVEADDPVCVISVMKMFTTVAAGRRGRVAEICVADEEMVEHGQTLMLIEEVSPR